MAHYGYKFVAAGFGNEAYARAWLQHNVFRAIEVMSMTVVALIAGARWPLLPRVILWLTGVYVLIEEGQIALCGVLRVRRAVEYIIASGQCVQLFGPEIYRAVLSGALAFLFVIALKGVRKNEQG